MESGEPEPVDACLACLPIRSYSAGTLCRTAGVGGSLYGRNLARQWGGAIVAGDLGSKGRPM
jgi:hypothetical protein